MHSHFPKPAGVALEDISPQQVLDLIEWQQQAGLAMVTDGALGWRDSISHYMSGFLGVRLGEAKPFLHTGRDYLQPIIEDELIWPAAIMRQEWRFLLEHATAPAKLVLTGPYTLARLCVQERSGNADTFAAQVEHLARTLSYEINAIPPNLLRSSVGMIQIEEPLILQATDDVPLVHHALTTIRKQLDTSLHLNLTTYFGDATPLWDELQQMPVESLGVDLVSSPELTHCILREQSDRDLVLGLIDGYDPELQPLATLIETVQPLVKLAGRVHLFISSSCGLWYLSQQAASAKIEQTVALAKHFEPMNRS